MKFIIISAFSVFSVFFSSLVSAACVDNATKCLSATSWAQCANNIWYTHPVPSGTVCDDSSGSVVFKTASNICTHGNQRCTGTTIRSFKQCSNNVLYNYNCPTGTKCSQSGSTVTCIRV